MKQFSQVIDEVLTKVEHSGFAVVEHALSATQSTALLDNCLKYQQDFLAAGIGRQNNMQLNKRIRKDKTLWLSEQEPIQQAYLMLMEQIRLAVNRHFYLGLFDYEAHFAKYEKGDFYKTHLDAFKGKSNRVLSTVCYLNTPEQGGELLIYKVIGSEIIARITPKAGTLVVFESERFPHEVLPAKALRYSIAGWFRHNHSQDNQIDPQN